MSYDSVFTHNILIIINWADFKTIQKYEVFVENKENKDVC